MQVYTGVSLKAQAKEALAEVTASWPKDLKPDFFFVFHSINQDASEVASELAKHYPGVAMAGCTTAGEHLNGKHYNGSLVISAVVSPTIRWRVRVIEQLDAFNQKVAHEAVDKMLAELQLDRDNLSPDKQFCLTFIDGLSMKEEIVSSTIAEALDGIPLLGGSAGDDLKFQQTWVIADGKAYGNAAVLVLGDSQNGFDIIKHQHFIKTQRQVVITKVDTKNRRVYEMDGLPAVEAYARALGLDKSQVTNEICFANPLLFRCNNEIYVRSIQRLEEDGSIIFYCGVEEGMVLEIGGHKEMEDTLNQDIRQLYPKDSGKKAQLFLACNCILRALEASSAKKHDELGEIVMNISNNVIGFDTYGEQLNGLHINQTLVGIAFGRAA